MDEVDEGDWGSEDDDEDDDDAFGSAAPVESKQGDSANLRLSM